MPLKHLFLDSETCGLHGMPVLLQYALEDGPVALYEVWKHPIHETLELIEWFCRHAVVFYNAAFDWFHIVKAYTTFRLADPDWFPCENIEEIALLEPKGQDGPCVKPASALDLMLYSRKGPMQSLMAREDIRIKQVPAALAYVLAKELASNLNWQVILGLSRFGGLRCPSEVLSLRLKWETGRFVVWSPKTEHHKGKDHRIVPLFPELRVILEKAYEVAKKEGYEYVVTGGYRQAAMGPNGWKNANLRTRLSKLIKRVGLTPWPRLFHNMRASRETELVSQFPIQVVTAWLGNTPTIAMQHYLQVRDSDYEAAIKGIGTSVVIPPPVSAPVLYGRDADGRQKSPEGLLSCISSAIAPHLAPPDVKYPCFSEDFRVVSIPAASTCLYVQNDNASQTPAKPGFRVSWFRPLQAVSCGCRTGKRTALCRPLKIGVSDLNVIPRRHAPVAGGRREGLGIRDLGLEKRAGHFSAQ